MHEENQKMLAEINPEKKLIQNTSNSKENSQIESHQNDIKIILKEYLNYANKVLIEEY